MTIDRIAVVPALAFALLMFLPRVAGADDIVVPNGDVAALIAAINTANANGLNDVIHLSPGGTYTLTAIDNGANGLPQIANDTGHTLEIKGYGATIERDIAAPDMRFFEVVSGAFLELTAVTLRNGRVVGANGAGAGASGNAVNGGAILVTGTVTLTACTLENNASIGGNGVAGASGAPGGASGAAGGAGALARGGAIYGANSSFITLTGCVLSNNLTAGGNGAAGGDGSAGDPGGAGGEGGAGGDAWGGAIFADNQLAMTGVTL
ncbi:MAG: hypothetical protein AB7S36_21405, partial [Planctomycetota bacterium]